MHGCGGEHALQWRGLLKALTGHSLDYSLCLLTSLDFLNNGETVVLEGSVSLMLRVHHRLRIGLGSTLLVR